MSLQLFAYAGKGKKEGRTIWPSIRLTRIDSEQLVGGHVRRSGNAIVKPRPLEKRDLKILGFERLRDGTKESSRAMDLRFGGETNRKGKKVATKSIPGNKETWGPHPTLGRRRNGPRVPENIGITK